MACATAAVPASRPGIHQHLVVVLVGLPPDPPKVSGLTAAAMGSGLEVRVMLENRERPKKNVCKEKGKLVC